MKIVLEKPNALDTLQKVLHFCKALQTSSRIIIR